MELNDNVKWEQIHIKFKELVKKYHPDKNQGNKKFEEKLKKITLAYSENLEIIDNSHKHKGHRFFSENKFHLHLKIKSSQLKSLSRVDAQKLIMGLLKDDLEQKIHALEISID